MPDTPIPETLLALIDKRIEAWGGFESLPADAQAAVRAKQAGRARGFFTVQEFAAVIGRNPHYVSDHCKARVIKTLRGGKPYRIPLSEEAAWNQVIP
jgi:hypothetical protein